MLFWRRSKPRLNNNWRLIATPLSHSPPDMTPHFGMRADRVTRLQCSCQSSVWLESSTLLTNVLAGCWGWGTFTCDCDDMIFAPRSGSSHQHQPAVVILFDGEALQPAAAAAAEERGKVCQEIVPSFLSAWAEPSTSSTPGLFAVSPAQPAQPSPDMTNKTIARHRPGLQVEASYS